MIDKNTENLLQILAFDELKQVEFYKCKSFIHRDHRWSLCILHHAQSMGWLPTPCDLILFDQHADGCEPLDIKAIKQLRTGNKITLQQVHELCSNGLYKTDDDWVVAGMELGLIRDALIFGVHDRHSCGALPISSSTQRDTITCYKDHCSQDHRVKIMGRPTHEISSRGYLGDLCYSDRDSWIWEIARWRYDIDKKCFDFLNEVDPVWIDFDLDFFAVEWDSYTFVWTDEIFKKEFLSPVGIGNRLWTAKEFIHGLLDRSGLLTIATEPDYCNQEVGVQEIWGKFNHYLFDDHLKILSSDK